MKLSHVLGLGTAVATGAGVLLWIFARVASSSHRPARRREYHRGLIVGDSLVAAPLLTQELTRRFGVLWDNVAVVGRNSGQILEQVRQSFRPGTHDVMVVSVGANDGARPLAWTQGHVQELVARARAGGADVVLFTEPPLRGYRNPPQLEALQRSEASRMWVLSGSAGADFVVDLHQVLGRGRGVIAAEFDAGDGLHPNAAGRRRLAQAVAQAVGVREGANA